MTIIEPTQKELQIITSFIENDKSKLEKLLAFVSLVLQENEKHNLIGKSTIHQIWTRHIIDSLQLVPYVKDSNNITDLGSGAGFPAIILGITTENHITMIEKSPVKAKFLQNTCQKLGLRFNVVNQTISSTNINEIITKNTTLTSRAFANIYNIFLLADNCKNINKIVLLKGDNYRQEIQECEKKNHILLKPWTSAIKKSITNQGVIICFNKPKQQS